MNAAPATQANEITLTEWVDNQLDSFAARLAGLGCWTSRRRFGDNANNSTHLEAVTTPGASPNYIFSEKSPCNATSMQIWLRDSGVTIEVYRRHILMSRKVIHQTELFTDSLAESFGDFVSAGES